MPNLATMAGPKLEALIDRLAETDRQANRAAIAAGLGNCRMADMRAIAAENGNLPHHRAARDAIVASDAYHTAVQEMEARRRYHGGRKPIPKA